MPLVRPRQLRVLLDAGGGDALRQFDVQRAEGLAAGLVEDADQVDHRIAALEVLRERRVADRDQRHAGHHFQLAAAALRMAGQHPHRVAAVGEPGHEGAANETRAAQYADSLNLHAGFP